MPTLVESSFAMGERTGDDEPILFARPRQWDAWLAKHHASSSGVWVRLAKKDSGIESITRLQAVEGALVWGWIDGQARPEGETSWLQRFTPRRPRSPWSKINRGKAEELIASGKMKAPGLAEVERAKADGRWDAAYDSPRNATVPDDLARALAANARASKFFETIDAANRYAILHRIHAAKKPDTRAARIAKFVEMLAKHETIHAPRAKKATKAKSPGPRTKRGPA
ncbi:YdeI/OmpD-associated family protein [Pendulispora rubella]|uniref:YdeI/OmpD-associated family protein n=1 Tax=Pendulispora rubella TaxID=2741070 RepID=A0ABZ2KTZ1_9BACT